MNISPRLAALLGMIGGFAFGANLVAWTERHMVPNLIMRLVAWAYSCAVTWRATR